MRSLLSGQAALLSLLSSATASVGGCASMMAERLSVVADAWPAQGRRLRAVREELQLIHAALARIHRCLPSQPQPPPAAAEEVGEGAEVSDG